MTSLLLVYVGGGGGGGLVKKPMTFKAMFWVILLWVFRAARHSWITSLFWEGFTSCDRACKWWPGISFSDVCCGRRIKRNTTSRCAGLKVRFRYLSGPNSRISWTRFRSKTQWQRFLLVSAPNIGRGTQAWCPHTKLYKFGKNVSPVPRRKENY